jgi:hypothetical protein
MADESPDFDLDDDALGEVAAANPDAFYTALRLALARLKAIEAQLESDGWEDVA